MKKIIVSLFLLFVWNSSFSQVRLIEGVVKSVGDSATVDSALIIISDFVFSTKTINGVLVKGKSFYYTLTDSTGRFEFKNVEIPGEYFDSTDEVTAITFRVIANHCLESNEYYSIEDDTMAGLEFYVTPVDYTATDTATEYIAPSKLYLGYNDIVFFAGSQIGANPYLLNYKAGFCYSQSNKITSVNYFNWELTPILYRRYYTKNDTVNTSSIDHREYYASIQSGIAGHFRTHLFNWDQKGTWYKNALYIDIGAEYNLPWHYWYVGKPDIHSKYVLKKFHKYNEFYLNARIGMINGIALKGQYRVTNDIFSGNYQELPRWSVELQAVFLLYGE